MRLSGRGWSMALAPRGWMKLLQMAHTYGWHPLGTIVAARPAEETAVPRDQWEDWDGSYFERSGQRVTDRDALLLAEALERALVDIPDRPATGPLPELSLDPSAVPGYRRALEPAEIVKDMLAEQGKEDAAGPEAILGPLAYFSGERKRWVHDFLAHCRQGGFTIE